MTIVIHDAAVVTVDDADRVVYGGAVAIEGDRIAAVGTTADLIDRYPAAERIDARGKAVMPGFANTHTHLSLVIARGLYEDLSPPNKPPFTGGLAPIPLPKLRPDEKVAMVRLGALEALRSGTTLLLEDGLRIAGYAEALATTGLRLLLCERAWDKANGSIGDPGGFEESPDLAAEGLARIEKLHAEWDGAEAGRVRVGLAAWAPDMCSPRLLKDVRRLQERLDAPATIHLNQIWGEVAAVEAIRGKLPTQYLDEVGFLGNRLVAAHCRCMAPAEEELLGRSGAAVAFNSCIAARRGLSPRVAELEAAGCTISIGTDNMAEDMVEATRTGLFMERVRRNDGRNPTPEQALRWGTRNGYRALEVGDGGALVQGHKADLVLVELRRAHLVPVLRVVSDIVHNAQARDVTDVMVDGRWLMRDGRVLTMDEEEVVADGQRVAAAAWERLFAIRPDLSPPLGFAPPER
jgi:5-methylthioadenosine/S-adenosylhomocysteine deaminase